MQLPPLVAYAGIIAALLNFAAFVMRDDVRLRQVAIGSNLAYIAYGVAGHQWIPLALHLTLLPLNTYRLRELLRERALIERATQIGDVSAEWLLPFMQRREYGPGEVLFHRGDPADRMFFLAEGRLRLDEIHVELAPGTLLGEIGIFSPSGTRTQTARALDPVIVYELHRSGVLALYRRDPAFGIYLVRLITRRLVEDIQIERAAAEENAAIRGAAAVSPTAG